MPAEDHKPYNEADECAQQALDAFFGSPHVQRFMLRQFGAFNARQNPAEKRVDVLAQSFSGDPVRIELEVKKTLGAWKGAFTFPDIQVADRKVNHFEAGDLFVMFDEPREWALVWDCATLPTPWERRHIGSQGGFLVVPLTHAALIKVKAEEPGPDVAFGIGEFGKPPEDQKLLSLDGF